MKYDLLMPQTSLIKLILSRIFEHVVNFYDQIVAHPWIKKPKIFGQNIVLGILSYLGKLSHWA